MGGSAGTGNYATSESGFSSSSAPMSRPARCTEDFVATHSTDPSKVALPAFGASRSSNQAAYLGYVGATGASDGAGFTPSVRPVPVKMEAAQRLGGGGRQ